MLASKTVFLNRTHNYSRDGIDAVIPRRCSQSGIRIPYPLTRLRGTVPTLIVGFLARKYVSDLSRFLPRCLGSMSPVQSFGVGAHHVLDVRALGAEDAIHQPARLQRRCPRDRHHRLNQGSGFRVQGSGFRVQGSGFMFDG